MRSVCKARRSEYRQRRPYSPGTIRARQASKTISSTPPTFHSPTRSRLSSRRARPTLRDRRPRLPDGPTEVTEPEKTGSNKALVERFVDQVLVRGDLSELTEYFATVPTPSTTRRSATTWRGCVPPCRPSPSRASRWPTARSTAPSPKASSCSCRRRAASDPRRPSSTTYSGVANGKIAQHWDVVFPIPADLPHTNGLFGAHHWAAATGAPQAGAVCA